MCIRLILALRVTKFFSPQCSRHVTYSRRLSKPRNVRYGCRPLRLRLFDGFLTAKVPLRV